MLVDTTRTSTQSSSRSNPRHLVPETETEPVVVTPQVSADTITDIQKIVGGNEDSQQQLLYSPLEQEDSNFLREMEENPTPCELDFSFSSLIRSLEESFEQYSIHPRQLFPESPKKSSPRKQVAFSQDNTVRFFHRTNSELEHLKRKKKKHIKKHHDNFDEWPLLRYFDEKLKRIEDFFIQEKVCLVQDPPVASDEKLNPIENFFAQEKVCSCQHPPVASFQEEEPPPAVPMRRVSPNALADDLVPDNENDDGNKNYLEVEPPKEKSFQSNTNNSANNTSNNSGLSDSSHISGLWFAVPYKSTSSPSHDASLDFLHTVDPTGFRVVNDSLLESDLDISILSNVSNGKNNSFNSSVSIARKKEVVDAAKRWATSQQDFFDKAHEGLGIAAKTTETTAETSRTSSPEDGPDLDESQDFSHSSSLEDGPDLDKPMDLKEERTGGTHQSKEWEVTEFGPDLDESRGFPYHQEDPDLALSEEWESFEFEPITDSEGKVSQKATADDADWLPFPSTTAKPAVFQDAPDMDEAKGWKPSQKEETPKKTIQSRFQSAPRKKWRQRAAMCRFHQASLNHVAGTVEKEALSKRVEEMAHAACISKSVKELAYAIEFRMSPTTESVVSSQTVETWADERKKNPAELPKLQVPVLDPAQPSPVSVTLL